ncbi:hypothetical protein ECKD2_00130 [Escherichia coli KD2]|jgi:hypothetical protein|nr:hypothetical protein ECKD2_00130 [Escherichia coli KD2]ETE11446.1 hypothetical protein V413_06105 [Escherichia coli LAU-EC8]ETE38504.1 hypothetical protein V414_06145 [Escherichia coli LAU-EC9]
MKRITLWHDELAPFSVFEEGGLRKYYTAVRILL